MPDYTITWEIDCEAINPREAAEQAWRMRSAPGSIANHFLVTNPAGETVTVDLAEAETAEFPWDGRHHRFRAFFDITVLVDAPTPEEAARLLENVDFDVRPIGGPVRLGLVQATTDRPVTRALIEESTCEAVAA